MKSIKVIKIISSGSVLINVGSRDGVTPDWRFDICGEGAHVFDPDTHEDYGFFGLIKAHVRPSRILEKMTECTNTETVFSEMTAFQSFNLLKDLNVEPTQISGRYCDEDMIIRIGDTVVRTRDYDPPSRKDSSSSNTPGDQEGTEDDV